MKLKLYIFISAVCLTTAVHAETAIRLSKNSVQSISGVTINQCTIPAENQSVVRSASGDFTIFTSDHQQLKFSFVELSSSADNTGAACLGAKSLVNRVARDLQLAITEINRGDIEVKIANNVTTCTKTVLDVLVDQNLVAQKWKLKAIAVHCP